MYLCQTAQSSLALAGEKCAASSNKGSVMYYLSWILSIPDLVRKDRVKAYSYLFIIYIA